MIIPDRKDSYLHQAMRRGSAKGATQSDDTLIRHLGIQPTDDHDSRQIVIAVRSTLYHFCQSSDTTLSYKYIPHFHARRFQRPMHSVIAEYAARLWESLLSPPTEDYQPAIRDVHRIKWAALNGFQIPRFFTHVLVDESHDLPKPVNQILHRSVQARAILGDDYQNLRGQATTRSHDLRQRELAHSVRSGKVIESIINPIIEQHPSPMKTPFLGNAQANLTIRYTKKIEIPPINTAILCSDTWELLEWTQRLASTGKRIQLLNDPDYLSVFVNDCIAPYSRTRGPRHPELFRYRSWDRWRARTRTGVPLS